MSKILKMLACITLTVLLLSGCKGAGEYSEPDDRRLVSAVGFDNDNGMIRVTLEAMEASGDTADGFDPYVLSETGTDTRQALARLAVQSTKELMFTHCGVFVLGEDLTPQQTEDLFGYCIGEKQVSLSAKVVSAESAKKLISSGTLTGESAGYGIIDIVDQSAEKLGIGGHAELYEIQTARLQTVNIYALPYIQLSNDTPQYDGMEVYVNDKPASRLSYEQSVSYAVLRNVFDGGEIICEDGVFSIDSASARITAGMTDGRLRVDIAVKSSPDSDGLISMIKKTVAEFDSDIFGIANVLSAQYPEIWEKIKDGYDTYYRNADIVIN